MALWRAAQRLTVTGAGRPLPPVTISVGVTAYPAQARTAAELLAAADAALYRANQAGRDRVRVAGLRYSVAGPTKRAVKIATACGSKCRPAWAWMYASARSGGQAGR